MLEIINFLIVLVTFIALIIGLINPSLIMFWSRRPTRLKIIGWWFLINFIMTTIFIEYIIS